MSSKARVNLLSRLKSREARVTEGLYLAEGRRLVGEALDSGAPVREILVTDDFATSPAGSSLLDRAEGVPVEGIAPRDLRRVADTKTPQGVVALLARREPDPAALEGEGLLLGLDEVADPGNVGTLVRAADAFGARAVIAGPGTADFENPKVLRAAMGSTFHLPLLPVGDLAAVLGDLGEGGTTIVSAVLDGEDVYGLAGIGSRVLVVLGNETRGVSQAVRATTDRAITVPCPGRAESLNVAMAGAVVLSCLARMIGGRA